MAAALKPCGGRFGIRAKQGHVRHGSGVGSQVFAVVNHNWQQFRYQQFQLVLDEQDHLTRRIQNLEIILCQQVARANSSQVAQERRVGHQNKRDNECHERRVLGRKTVAITPLESNGEIGLFFQSIEFKEQKADGRKPLDTGGRTENPSKK